MNEDQKAKTLKRQMTYRAELKRRGGKVTTVYLSPEAVKSLKVMAYHSGLPDKEIINRALVAFQHIVVSSQPL